MTPFAQRRAALAKLIGRDAIAIVVNPPAAPDPEYSHRNYRPNNDFYYLTGFSEANAVAVFLPTEQGCDFILFNEPYDPAQAQWEGARAGQEGACRLFGATHSYPIADLDKHMPSLLSPYQSVYFPMHPSLNMHQRVHQWVEQLAEKIRTGLSYPTIFRDIHSTIANFRLYKDETELNCMRRAAAISVTAHERAMRSTKPGINEADLYAAMMHTFISHGCFQPAYTPIIGGGNNACILHYSQNNAVIKAGDLVLIDAGVEYDYYASDITRTFPANGRFTGEQRAIYEIVLAAQSAGIATIAPGHRWDEAQEAIVKIITQGLVDLKILSGDIDNLIETKAYTAFYMHRSGHWIGLATHDVGAYKDTAKQWRKLEAGMVLTVEPGIYINPNSPGVDERWQGIGIRIEDDLAVTQTGHEILSAGLVKTVAEIESIVGKPE
ncbi:MAG: Xaa-Pro aminopeptidase [Gammaproteobacteria bacterium]|jgi:Xaa-Pro aminopeptidase|nr:Xaa-Pro aminopeptidase [Gammaproteobacteria bacterium]